MPRWTDRIKEGVGDLGHKTTETASAAVSGTARGARRLGDAAADGAGVVKEKAGAAAGHVRDQAGALLAFLHTRDLLKWSESITEGPGTLYDKAMDAEYLRSHIGGGDHRLFDGGHDLAGAWQSVQEASSTDSLTQEVMGYVTGLWKDLTTIKGLPVTTVDKGGFDAWADRLSTIPGVNREWLVDLLSFDAFEVLSAGLGAVGALFFLSRDDQEGLARVLGSMGIVAIIGANPLLGLVVIALTGYAYFKKVKIDRGDVARGAVLAGVSAGIFALLGLPILVELVIVMVVGHLLRKHLLDEEDLIRRLKAHAGEAAGKGKVVVEGLLSRLGGKRGGKPSTHRCCASCSSP